MRRRSSLKFSTVVIILVIVILSIIVYSQRKDKLKLTAPGNEESDLTVYMLDVGQGDCTFIDNGEKDILIDAATNDEVNGVIDSLYQLGVEDIEYAFFTHPHEDHIGGADEILRNFNVKNVIMPNAKADTECYEEMMKEIKRSGAKLWYACAGDEYVIGEVSFDILSPEMGDYYSNENLYSLVIRMSYEDIKYLFTGDAETHNENIILENYPEMLDCDVLSVAHHGSTTSTSEEFLAAVSPYIAVISVGEDNAYGHPHREILKLLRAYVDEVYRTDRHGNVIISTNGKEIWVEK